MTFATDIDLLHWEPNIFRDAAFASQTLLTGSGASIAGGVLTIASGSFIDSKIPADSVVVLSGPVAGSFPIISIDSATACTISVMYEDLYPEEGEPEPAPVGLDAPEPGLIGIKDRVDALGGRMEVESPSGKGTSLFVRIPTWTG